MATQPQQPSPSSETDAHLSRLLSNKHVLGILLLSALEHAIIRQLGPSFEGEEGRKYARVVSRWVSVLREGVGELEGSAEGNAHDRGHVANGVEKKEGEVRFVRIRTRRHELLITPDDKYVLVVLQDPSS